MSNIKRRCIVTNQILDVSKMIRVVKLKNGEFKVNSSEAGRGAYVSNNLDYFNEIIRKKVLNRSFKTNVSNDVYMELKRVMRGEHER